MIKVNLLPQSKIKKGEHPEIIALAQLTFVAVLIFFGAQYFLKALKLGNVENDLKLARAEHSKYQAIINELNSIKALTAELETKKALISNLMASRTAYPIFMEDLIDHFPRTMWLSSLNTQLAEDRTLTFNFSAVALSIYTIADLVKAMESSSVLSKVELGAINQSGSEPSFVYGFTMKAVYKKPDAPVPAK